MSQIGQLDPSAKPPNSFKTIYKYYQKASAVALADDANVLNFTKDYGSDTNAKVSVVRELQSPDLTRLFAQFAGADRKGAIARLEMSKSTRTTTFQASLGECH